jgi:hypothetical protein
MSAAGRTRVSLGTATPGGGFPVYGEAVAATINEVDPTLDVPHRGQVLNYDIPASRRSAEGGEMSYFKT